MDRRAFPVLYVTDLRRSVEFYARLGYESVYQFPLEGDPHYVGLERGDSSLGLSDSGWPEAQLVGTAPRFELFVYVDDVEAQVATFREAGYEVLQEPATMPWRTAGPRPRPGPQPGRPGHADLTCRPAADQARPVTRDR